MNKPLTQKEFENILIEKYCPLYYHKWKNYPNSTFYYNIENYDSTTDNVGIYTNKTTYSLEKA